ncbi:MAG: hypothetical protein ACI83N_001461, partial [Hydrogenophaga sp.]
MASEKSLLVLSFGGPTRPGEPQAMKKFQRQCE